MPCTIEYPNSIRIPIRIFEYRFRYSLTSLKYILNIQALGLVVSEKKMFSCYSHFKPMVDNDAS